MPAAQELSFGSHPLQRLDFYRSPSPGPRPLILFVHGGAWIGGDKSDSTGEAKIRHYTQAGYQLASVNYRLLPEVDIEHQADDVAASLASLLEQARDLNIDTRRLVLMGHSAGAHLAALVATDPRYLKRYGLTPGDIGGVALLDGAAYDVPSQIMDAGPLLGFAYQIAFGSGPARQSSLSPASHTATGNARDFLLLHVERPDAERQAFTFADALESGGTRARVAGVKGRGMEGHNRINAMLGRSDSDATPIVDEWLAGLFGSRAY
ncbi:alpha/beta hydrolase [Croceicoccus sp. Ery15]|uniref:alpha/beta hydrolase n=1 Tax=Croceicoccus sp. Ery15 TaxID=1703338 RepID=UPI001E4CA5CA|nr:alpha/beta hydrolase [Croceicoccus sp. Ery15]